MYAVNELTIIQFEWKVEMNVDLNSIQFSKGENNFSNDMFNEFVSNSPKFKSKLIEFQGKFINSPPLRLIDTFFFGQNQQKSYRKIQNKFRPRHRSKILFVSIKTQFFLESQSNSTFFFLLRYLEREE